MTKNICVEWIFTSLYIYIYIYAGTRALQSWRLLMFGYVDVYLLGFPGQVVGSNKSTFVCVGFCPRHLIVIRWVQRTVCGSIRVAVQVFKPPSFDCDAVSFWIRAAKTRKDDVHRAVDPAHAVGIGARLRYRIGQCRHLARYVFKHD